MREMRWAVALIAVGIGGAQDFASARIERVSTGHRFAEGPAWSSEGFLLFSDVPANHILKLTPGKGTSGFQEGTSGISGNAYDSQGRLYSCETRARRVVRHKKDGQVEVIAERFEGKRLNAPNDLAIRKDGHLYFTDPAFGKQAEGRELDFYGVYHVTPRGEVELVAKPKGRPNGIALSANGKVLYVSNSDERNVRAYDLDRNGKASGERVVVARTEGPPDGLTLDERGNLYVASRALYVYDPEGKFLQKFETAEPATNCTFGDPDFQTLYITAQTSVYRVRLDVKGAVQN